MSKDLLIKGGHVVTVDPVAVMALGTGPTDVETVIGGGDIVKRDKKLTGDHAAKGLELMHATRRHLRA